MLSNFPTTRRQEGVVLIIALIILVAMTLAGLGLIRTVDTGILVSGNIGYREAAVASGDSGIELARTWLMANPNTLSSDQPTAGYYASRQDSVDITGNATTGTSDGVDWGGSNPAAPVKAFDAGTGVDGTGNHIYYIIQRLCLVPGTSNSLDNGGQNCTTSTVTGLGSTQAGPTYAVHGIPTTEEVFYRVTSRIEGPKNTVSYVQAIIEM